MAGCRATGRRKPFQGVSHAPKTGVQGEGGLGPGLSARPGLQGGLLLLHSANTTHTHTRACKPKHTSVGPHTRTCSSSGLHALSHVHARCNTRVCHTHSFACVHVHTHRLLQSPCRTPASGPAFPRGGLKSKVRGATAAAVPGPCQGSESEPKSLPSSGLLRASDG